MVLIPRISAKFFLQAPNLAPVAGCAALLLVIAVIWSYASQVRSMGWPWRGLLPLLRGLAVLALAASLVKPVAVRVASAAQRGTVLVLVDRSRSMSITDNSRTIAQTVALADALDKLPHGLRSEIAPGLSAVLEHLSALAADVKAAQDDLDYARVSGATSSCANRGCEPRWQVTPTRPKRPHSSPKQSMRKATCFGGSVT